MMTNDFTVLERTLAIDYRPASNLKGTVTGANWTFLLPTLEIESILCLGVPPASTLATLGRIARTVLVACEKEAQIHEARHVIQQAERSNIYPVQADVPAQFPFSADSIDLLVLTGEHQVNGSKDKRNIRAPFARFLKPGGLVYAQISGLFLTGDELREDVTGSGESQVFWLTPITGEMQTAVPVNDRDTIRYFYREGLYTPLIRYMPFARIERFLSRHPLSRIMMQRFSMLIGPGAGNLAHSPPAYLRSIAGRAGVDIENHRWGLSAKGKYNTRKVLIFLYNRDRSIPEYIAKMTRNPAFNPRLENEHRALLLLQDMGIGDPECLPRVVFFGYHSDLAVVGETLVVGDAFREKTKASADCPYALSAVNWLTELGASTADLVSAAPENVAAGLGQLFCRFMEIYQLDAEHRHFLEDQISRIKESPEGFPLVFQHGDPGTWNVKISTSGKAAFLDWEAAEPKGMPLWDLFYFLRSYCTWVASAQGVRNSLEGFERYFLKQSPLSSLVVDSVRNYCERVKLRRDIVEPLFYTCWMHRSLKEAPRLRMDHLERGHYVSLLRRSINQREAPTLHKLFSEI
jgi:hypothetical protein